MRYSPLLPTLLLILFSVLSLSYAQRQLPIDPTPDCLNCPIYPDLEQVPDEFEAAGWVSPPADPNGTCASCPIYPDNPDIDIEKFCKSYQGIYKPETNLCFPNPDNCDSPSCTKPLTTTKAHCDLQGKDFVEVEGESWCAPPLDTDTSTQAKEPNALQRILESTFSDVLAVIIVALATALGAYLIPPVRKRLSKLLGRNKPLSDATAETEKEEEYYP